MSRLLAVSWEMPPMYGPRATQVARTLEHLGEHGWESTVVCLAPRRGGPHWRDNRDAAPLRHVRRIGVASPEESVVARAVFKIAPILRGWPDEKWLWIRRATAAAMRAATAETPAGIVTFAQPWSDHLVGLRVRRSLVLPWIAHFSDPWTDSPYIQGTALQRSAWARMEAEVIRRADSIVFVTEQTADLVMRKYPDGYRAKVSIVPHGYDRRALLTAASGAHGAQWRQSAKDARPLRMVCTGRFYSGVRTPLGLFAALARLDAERPLAGRLEVRLMGPHVVEFSADARRLNIAPIVRLEHRQPAETAMNAAAEADVLLSIDAPSDGPSVFLPSKLVDYLMFRKPILGLTPLEGASADLLRRAGCPVAPPDDPAAIAAAIAELMDRASTDALAVDAGFDAVAEEYDIRRTTERFHHVLAKTFERRAA
jgi:glycosyltransferase involved in cell wall biosynthesis